MEDRDCFHRRTIEFGCTSSPQNPLFCLALHDTNILLEKTDKKESRSCRGSGENWATANVLREKRTATEIFASDITEVMAPAGQADELHEPMRKDPTILTLFSGIALRERFLKMNESPM